EDPERPGSGLGLAIVRAIVTAHGGNIWIEETGAGGTAVVLELPIEEGPAGRPGGVARPADRGGTRVKVLVVDDEPQIRRALRTSLEAHGYVVETVGTRDDGVGAAAGQHPELILLDLGLPDMDGTEVIKRVRAF